MSIISSIQRAALAPSVFIGNAISNAIKPGSGRTTTSQLQSTIPGKILGSGIALGALGLGAAAAPAGSIAAAARSLIPSTTKGKIIGAASVPVIAGLLSTNPKAPFQAISNLGTFGQDLGTFTGNPSFGSAVDIVKNSPLISAGLGAAGVGLAGAAIVPAIASFANTQATRKNTEALLGSGGAMGIREIETTQLPSMQEDDLVQAEPIVEGSSAPRKRRKARSKPSHQTISQRVNVRVNSVSGNRKYIKNVMYN